jgi:cytoskeletal protein CcmA (bactofilin family)
MLGRTRKEVDDTTPEKEPAPAPSDDVSIISNDMVIRGECRTHGRLRVEGRIAGNVAATAIELAPSGSVEGDVFDGNGGKGAATFVIDGRVSGTVRAPRVEIRGRGSVGGGVVADEAVIGGRVRGGVQARVRLALEATAEVEGEVLARRLALEEGGRVNGNIRMGDDAVPSTGAA